MSAIKFCLAQLNFKIGDFEGNTAKIADTIFNAKQKGAAHAAADNVITGRGIDGHQRFTRHGHRISLTVLVEGSLSLWLLKC